MSAAQHTTHDAKAFTVIPMGACIDAELLSESPISAQFTLSTGVAQTSREIKMTFL